MTLGSLGRMELHDPALLWLLLPAVAALMLRALLAPRPRVMFPSASLLAPFGMTLRATLSRGLFLLRIAAVMLVIIALARPQLLIHESSVDRESIDIVLAVDTSTSMLAEDFELKGRRVNRLEAVKDVVRQFIEHRSSDRISLVAFASEAYTVSPLTFDYDWVLENLARLETGMIEDGTAIGSAVATSLNRLKESEAKQKVIILLTDGMNNAGTIQPLTAAEAAAALGIRVYAIGAGTKGLVPYPARGLFGQKTYQQVQIDIDDEMLTALAAKTGARYFRATDTEQLKNIYDEIDTMEKTPLKETGYVEYEEVFEPFVLAALLLLMLEVMLGNTVLRRLPL